MSSHAVTLLLKLLPASLLRPHQRKSCCCVFAVAVACLSFEATSVQAMPFCFLPASLLRPRQRKSCYASAVAVAFAAVADSALSLLFLE